MSTVAVQGQSCGRDRLDRADRIPLDARDLDESADRVAGQPEMVLHADLGGVLDLLGSASDHLGQRTGSHRAGAADLALAADLGPGDGRGLLVDGADRRGHQQEADDGVVVDAGHEPYGVVEHRRDDAGRPVGRCRDDPTTGRVLLVHRESPHSHPVDGLHRITQLAHLERVHLRAGAQPGVQGAGSPPDLESARQHADRAAAVADALGHHRPDPQQPGPDLGLRSAGALVGEHHVADPQAGGDAVGEQLVAGTEVVRHRGRIGDEDRVALGVGRDDEPAADRVVRRLPQQLVGAVVCGEGHAVGVVGQPQPSVQDHVVVEVDADLVGAVESDPGALGDLGDPEGTEAGVDGLRVLALQAPEHRLVAAVAVSGGAERAEQLGLDPYGPVEELVGGQPFDEPTGGPHRADRVGAGRADADAEQVERADGHRDCLPPSTSRREVRATKSPAGSYPAGHR